MTPWEAAGVLLAIFQQVLDVGFLSRHADTWVQTRGRDRNAENYQDSRIPASSDSESVDFKWKRRPLLLSFLQSFLCCQLPLLETDEHYRCSPRSSLEQRRHADRYSFRISASSSLFPILFHRAPPHLAPHGSKKDYGDRLLVFCQLTESFQ